MARAGLAGAPWGMGGTLRKSITTAMTKNPAAETKSAVPVLTRSIRKPAMAGPTMRVPCQMLEFRATALVITERSIRWGKKAWRAGLSKASTAPVRKAITRMCHTSTTPVMVSRARARMSSPVPPWVQRISTRLSILSANTPPTRLKKMPGMALAASA